jgi:amidohydrolase
MNQNSPLDQALSLFDYSQSIRRDLHRNPEIGFHEFRTSQVVINELAALGYEVQSGIAETGVVGLLPGLDEYPVIMLRFDMDALPIQEENQTDYVSQNPGVMHACGHDAHVAIGLTVARLLASTEVTRRATIKLIFQPAEEGLGGAERMIAEGVLTNPKPDFALGLHVWNEQPTGWMGLSSGPIMAGADTFRVNIQGKGGHGGHPHETIDPIIAAAQVVSACQTIVSRTVSPLDSAVVSFCQIQGGSTFNVIPHQVVMGGTIRSYLPKVRANVLQKIERIVENISRGMGCEGTVEVKEITPTLINHSGVANKLIMAFRKKFDTLQIDDHFQTMVSEDFAFFLKDVPGAFFFVGSSNANLGLNFGHHHPQFDIDEMVIPIAVSLMIEAVAELSQKSLSGEVL